MFDNRKLIGSIYLSKFPYYDLNTRSGSFKSRPVLIIEVENQFGLSDVTALPLSRIKDESRIIKEYDVKIQKKDYPDLKLKFDPSYIRASKIATINTKDLAKTPLVDLKKLYPSLYETVIENVKDYVNKMTI